MYTQRPVLKIHLAHIGYCRHAVDGLMRLSVPRYPPFRTVLPNIDCPFCTKAYLHGIFARISSHRLVLFIIP